MIELVSMIFENIPFPPSTNTLFAGKTRRYKSQKYKFWSQEFDLWAVKNMGSIRGTSATVREHLTDPKNFLSLSVELNVPPSMIFTKDGRNKQIDATNYIKALLDALAPELKIDDSRIFLSNVEFVVYNGPKSPNVTVFIERTRIREKNFAQKKDNEKEKERGQDPREYQNEDGSGEKDPPSKWFRPS